MHGFTRDSWKPWDSQSKCHRLLGAVPLVALPTTEKQGFARVFHGSSCRSHAAPGVPEDANRTSMASHIAESLVFPTFLKAFGKPSGFRSIRHTLLGRILQGLLVFPLFLHFSIVHIPAVTGRPEPCTFGCQRKLFSCYCYM